MYITDSSAYYSITSVGIIIPLSQQYYVAGSNTKYSTQVADNSLLPIGVTMLISMYKVFVPANIQVSAKTALVAS